MGNPDDCLNECGRLFLSSQFDNVTFHSFSPVDLLPLSLLQVGSIQWKSGQQETKAAGYIAPTIRKQ